MENKKKNEFIAVMSSLLENYIKEEQPPPENAPTPAASDEVELLTIKECCEAVKGLNEYTVRQLVRRNAVPFVRAGRGKNGKVLIPKAALLDYLRGGSTG